MPNKKIVVIPTYNESENISSLISGVLNYVADTDILIVDDNSPDATAVLVGKISAIDARIKCLRRAAKQGLGKAYIDGFKYALRNGYEYIAQMDADFSHDPKYLKVFFELIADYDLVIGSRFVRGGGVRNRGIFRRLTSRVGSLYAQMVLGVKIADFTSGFKVFRRALLENIGLGNVISSGYFFNVETAFRAARLGSRIKESPIIFTERKFGKTKMNCGIIIEAMINIWRLRFFSR